MDSSSLVSIGKILKVSGLKGSLKIKILTDFPERFVNLKKVYLLKDEGFILNKYTKKNVFCIENHSVRNKQLKLKFLQYDTIEDASELNGCLICIEPDERVILQKDQYYYDELINLDVYSDSENIGKVIKIENYGSGDLLLVENKNEKRFYIPMRKQFIKSIDIGKNNIIVTLIEGFTEELLL